MHSIVSKDQERGFLYRRTEYPNPTLKSNIQEKNDTGRPEALYSRDRFSW
jgi:hypothetical protein